MGLTVNRHPLADCQNCPLFDNDYAFVPSFGPKKADIGIVGQNPGTQEIRIGKPFIGPSGRLLDQVLKYYNLDRSQMFVGNMVGCTAKRHSTMKPPAAAVNACRPRLMQELKDRGVKQIIALGNVPAQGLLGGRESITRLRVGTYREMPELPGVQIFCTYHPAACLRGAQYFPSMATDFGKLVNPPPPWQEPKYVVWEDSATAIRGILALQKAGINDVSFDIETAVAADKDNSYEHPYRYKILCIGMAYSPTKAIVIGKTACQDPNVLRFLWHFLRRCKRIRTQNGKFDKQGVHNKGVQFVFTEDTMLKSYILDERPGHHGLKAQLEERLGYPRYGDEIKQYLGVGKKKSFANVPLDILYRYNAYDTCGTFALDTHLSKLLADDDWAEPVLPRFDGERWGLVRLHQFMTETANNLAFVELNGFPVDLKYNAKLTKEYDAELRRLENNMFALVGGLRFNPRSPKQLQGIFRALGVPLPMVKRPNGTYSETTDAATLKSLYDDYRAVVASGPKILVATISKPTGNEIGPEVAEVHAQGSIEVAFLEALMAYRKAAKTNGTYVRGLYKYVYKGRVYPTVNIHTTVSGRTSQKRPSLQVIPHADEIKRQFVVSKPEHVLIEADYKQIELRVLTWLAREEYFREVFSDPSRDLFTELADIVKPERSRKTNMHPKDRRNIVKAFVYGLAYGREAQSIADEYGIPLVEAQRMQREFFAVIPNIVKFREWVKREATSQNDLVTPFGRRRRFCLITEDNKKEVENEALSFFPQSIASDCLIQAFNELRPAMKGLAWVRNLVHDALFAETHQDNVEKVSDMIVDAMIRSAESVMGKYVRIDVDVEVGRTWGDMVHLHEHDEGVGWLAGERPYPTTLARRDQWERPAFQLELHTESPVSLMEQPFGLFRPMPSMALSQAPSSR